MGKSSHIQGNKGVKFSQQLRGLNLEQVLLVAIDAAKLHQKALICNYFGDVIERPFFFSVNHSGMQTLCRKIDQAVNHFKLFAYFLVWKPQAITMKTSFVSMAKYGYQVQIFNPYSTFEERASALNWCKTDDLDLIAIAHAIKNNKATEIRLIRRHSTSTPCFHPCRRSEVRKRSMLRMEIRIFMDNIWREFQGYADHKDGRGP